MNLGIENLFINCVNYKNKVHLKFDFNQIVIDLVKRTQRNIESLLDNLELKNDK